MELQTLLRLRSALWTGEKVLLGKAACCAFSVFMGAGTIYPLCNTAWVQAIRWLLCRQVLRHTITEISLSCVLSINCYTVFSILLSQLTAHVCAAAGTLHLMCWHYGLSNTPLVSTLMTLCDLDYARCYTWQTESDTYQKCACRLFQSPFSKHHQIPRRHLLYVCCSMVLSQCSWSHTTNVSNARKMCSQATSNMDHAVVHYQPGSSSPI